MEFSQYVTLVVIVPESHADQVREAMGKAGAGKVGNYSFCSFSIKGTGRFKPDEKANPFIGTKGEIEAVAEERIETICSRESLKSAIAAIKASHPYEEIPLSIYPIYDLGTLG